MLPGIRGHHRSDVSPSCFVNFNSRESSLRLANGTFNTMSRLHVISDGFSDSKEKAIDYARQAQASIIENCAKIGKEPPPYNLHELIGKGSFGRVYKASYNGFTELVAVKIIDIEEGDSHAPRASDTFTDILHGNQHPEAPQHQRRQKYQHHHRRLSCRSVDVDSHRVLCWR